jgi:hypothetical protein
MISSLFLLALGSVFTVPAAAQKAETLIPLSSTGYAFQRGNAASNIVVELYIDLTCSSCLSEWPTINEVVAAYSADVNFLYRILPLPYHQQAFITSKAASCVNYYCSSEAVFTFFDTVYANQALIYNSATANMTYNEVVDLVEGWALDGTGLTSAQYAEGMNSSTTAGSSIEMNSRYMFKYATLHDIWATPVFAINGVIVLGLDDFNTWSQTLDSLLASRRK